MLRLAYTLRRGAPMSLLDNYSFKVYDDVQKLLDEANDTFHMKDLATQYLPLVYYHDVEGCGSGMFAQEKIKRDTLVDYTYGNIVLYPDPEEKLNYLHVDIKIKNKAGRLRTVDAVYTMGDSYFINHACINPNLTGVPRTLECPSGSIQIKEYYTNRRVYPHEQLTLDYYTHLDQETKKEVLDDHPKPGFVKCRCSPVCYNYIRYTTPVPVQDAH